MKLHSQSYLLGIAAIVLVGAYLLGHLEPRIHNDSSSYLEYQWNTSSQGFNGFRTPIYPALAQVVVSLLGLRGIPWVQAFIYIGAILWFHRSMRAAGFRELPALLVASGLMFGRPLWDYAGDILSDSLAMSLGIISCGCFLRTIDFLKIDNENRGPSIAVWIGLATATGLTFITRPAYLFLLVLWPVLGIWYWWTLPTRRSHIGAYVLSSLVPFLLYSSCRWLLVGQFGIVSFGGYNSIGVASQGLDRELVQSLSPKTQPLAMAIVEGFEARGMPRDTRGGFVHLERYFSDSIWAVSVPAAKEIYGDDTYATNLAFKELSWQFIQLRPGYYLRWIFENVIHGLRDMAEMVWTDHGSLLGIFGGLIAIIGITIRHRRARISQVNDLTKVSRGGSGEMGKVRWLELQLYLWTSVGYGMAKLMLVVLVEPSIGRYMTAAASLLPGLLILVLFHWIEQVWQDSQDCC